MAETLSRSCARRVPCWLAFPSLPALRSTGSAADRSALFALKLWSTQDPANVRGAKDLLGQASFQTTGNCPG